MRKTLIIALFAVLLAAQSGCGAASQPSGQEQNLQAVQGTSSEQTQDSDAENQTLPDTEPEASSQPQSTDNGEETDAATAQMFTNMEFKMSKGDLYVRTGSDFSLTYQKGNAADYEIIDGTLYFDNNQSGAFVLTLPEGESYERLLLTVGEGHVYVESSLSLQNLELTVARGEASLEGLNISKGSSIDINQGSASLSGDPGASITANCEQGHLYMDLSFDKSDCNYSVELSGGGNIQVGDESYHGRSASRTVDNGGTHSIVLNCYRGDISVVFGGSGAATNTGTWQQKRH